MTQSTPFLTRYLKGDREAVWDELVALGARVQESPLFDDAMAVAREVVQRAQRNIELLYRRLLDFGYQFKNPEAAFVSAGPEAPARISEIERRLGSLPLVVRVWYESIASVDFSQAKSQLRGPTGPDVNGLGSHAELIMHSLDRCWASWLDLCKEDEEHHQKMARIKVENPDYYHNMPDSAKEIRPPEPFLPTGGAASSCEMKGFALPSRSIDGVLYCEGGKVYFVHALRRCFEWGGFPYCRNYFAGNKPLPWEAQPNFEKLIPLLREGLIPV